MKEIKLFGGHVVLVDDEDYDWLNEYSWHLRQNPKMGSAYPCASVKENGQWKEVPMHRMILGANDGDVVDHVDMDKMNNRKENLRFATRGLNRANSLPNKSRNGEPPTSKYKGVTRTKHKKGNKTYSYWRAQITVNGTTLYLGSPKSEIEAACLYDIAAHNYFGEYARLNFDGAAYDEWYDQVAT
jgi:hypothetical protein